MSCFDSQMVHSMLPHASQLIMAERTPYRVCQECQRLIDCVAQPAEEDADVAADD